MGNRLRLGILIATAVAWIVAILLLVLSPANAQCSGQPGANQVCAGPTSGGSGLPGWRVLVGADMPAPLTAPITVNSTVILGGTNLSLPYNNNGKYGEYVLGGDCSFTGTFPSLTCTKTGGVLFATSATTDATNANNIGAGTLNSARLNLATTSDFAAATPSKVLSADRVFGPEYVIPFSATPTIDFSQFVSNASLTLVANVTAIGLSNVKAGQAGLIRFIQGSGGGFTIPAAIHSTFKCAGGCNYTLSTAAGAVDVLGYTCITTTYCIGGALLKDVK